jgi:N-carbamoylputrescine amidase
VYQGKMRGRTSKSIRIALAQLRCLSDPRENIASATRAIESASHRSADLCVLPELFTNHYVGQFQDTKSTLAKVPDHKELLTNFRALAGSHSIALLVPFIERDGKKSYNAVTLIGRDGSAKAHYRKNHIPNGIGYREDLYFKPGNLGYVVASLDSVRIGLAICWDQWFPEVSRILALQGAQVIVYPSAIGSEIVEPDFDSRPSWELVMRAQAVMNRIFVAAVNRVGQEEQIRFYGGSFVADPWGQVVRRASTRRPELLVADVDLEQIDKANSFFGFFDSRRPQTYDRLTKPRLSK